MEWKDKLYDHEVPPPDNLWGKISHDLDNDSFIVFKQKLFHHQQEPPAGIWNKIERILHGDTSVIPLTRRNTFKVWRIAAAAAIIGIAFFTVNYFLSRPEPATPPVAQKNKANTASPSGTPTQVEAQQAVPGKQPVIASRFVRAKANANAVNSVMRAESVYSDGANVEMPSLSTIVNDETALTDRRELSSASDRRIRNLRGEIKEDVSMLDLPNSYFLMTGPNGQAVRVSSKFRNTIQYLNGAGNEELLDVILRESHYWKNLFTEWKEKVSNSSFVPSSQNFMDITELMKLLQQNTDNK